MKELQKVDYFVAEFDYVYIEKKLKSTDIKSHDRKQKVNRKTMVTLKLSVFRSQHRFKEDYPAYYKNFP